MLNRGQGVKRFYMGVILNIERVGNLYVLPLRGYVRHEAQTRTTTPEPPFSRVVFVDVKEQP